MLKIHVPNLLCINTSYFAHYFCTLLYPKLGQKDIGTLWKWVLKTTGQDSYVHLEYLQTDSNIIKCSIKQVPIQEGHFNKKFYYRRYLLLISKQYPPSKIKYHNSYNILNNIHP
jgi:hypothetical protein